MTRDLEKRVKALEARLDVIEPHISRSIPLGPGSAHEKESDEERKRQFEKIVKKLTKDIPPVDRNNQQLIDGGPVPEDWSHTKLKANGQQEDYIVLTAEERAKGFVRPVRRSYRHVGRPAPRYALRDLTDEEKERWAHAGYVKFEPYPESMKPKTGRFYTQDELDAVGNGCGSMTTMSSAIAETYARDPKFYGGTFCCGCGKHFPVGEQGEFVWEGTNERVGT